MTNDEAVVHTVEPGFNAYGGESNVQALTDSTSIDDFDDATREVLESDQSFVLRLGPGFENADVAAGLIAAPCFKLAAVEQLRFLQARGLQRIEMGRLHGTLAQNARALGIEVVVDSQ
jgi:hypothetical protein